MWHDKAKRVLQLDVVALRNEEPVSIRCGNRLVRLPGWKSRGYRHSVPSGKEKRERQRERNTESREKAWEGQPAHDGRLLHPRSLVEIVLLVTMEGKW